MQLHIGQCLPSFLVVLRVKNGSAQRRATLVSPFLNLKALILIARA